MFATKLVRQANRNYSNIWFHTTLWFLPRPLSCVIHRSLPPLFIPIIYFQCTSECDDTLAVLILLEYWWYSAAVYVVKIFLVLQFISSRRYFGITLSPNKEIRAWQMLAEFAATSNIYWSRVSHKWNLLLQQTKRTTAVNGVGVLHFLVKCLELNSLSDRMQIWWLLCFETFSCKLFFSLFTPQLNICKVRH